MSQLNPLAAKGIAVGRLRPATAEPLWLKLLLIGVALTFLTLFLLLPLVIVFGEAFAKGWQVYVASITEPAAAHAIKLTLLAALIAVPANVRSSGPPP